MDLSEACQKMRSEGKPIEEVLGFLRASGVGKVESIKYLVDLGVCSLADAKQVVHNSETWSNVRTRDEEFHNTVEGSVKIKE